MERGFSAKLKTFSKDYMSLVAVIIIFNIWGKGMFKIIPILMGVVISYVVAVIMNAVGLTNPDGDEQCYEYFPADSNRSDCGNWPGNVDHNWSG